MSNNQSVVFQSQVSLQHKNIFVPITFTDLGDYPAELYVNFPVKEINVRTAHAYCHDSNDPYSAYVLRSNAVDPAGEVIAVLSDYKGTTDAGTKDWYGSGFNYLGGQKFIYTNPVQIWGRYNINITELINGDPPQEGKILVWFEFVG